MTVATRPAYPAVYAPQRDTWLLGEALDEALAARSTRCRVLDIGTGSGALAVRAAAHPNTTVTAVDISDESLLAAGLAAHDHEVTLRLLAGDLATPVVGERFDVIVTNPPYVPAPHDEPGSGPARAWDAGPDGRAILDRLAREVPPMLAGRGEFLVVQSELSGIDATRHQLEEQGLVTAVVARCEHAFGPVLSERVAYLEETGLIEPGRRVEGLAVIRARRP